MNNYFPLIRPAQVRFCLLLHGMFLVLYGFHLVSPMSRLHAVLSLVLATLTLLLLTIPRVYIEAAWFIRLVALGNATVLSSLIVDRATSPTRRLVQKPTPVRGDKT